MSQCSFIAANVPLEEVVSPYCSAMTMNEAASSGLRPGEDPADNFSLSGFPFARCYCGMDYAVSIETGFIRANEPGLLCSGDMTPEKAERIADYLLLASRRPGKPLRRGPAHLSLPARGGMSGFTRIFPENNAKSPCITRGLLL